MHLLRPSLRGLPCWIETLAMLALGCAGTAAMRGAESASAGGVPENVRVAFGLSPFYAKHLDAGGIPIVASTRVSDFALLEARYLIDHIIGHRPDILSAIAAQKVRVVVMAATEFTTDIPEHRDLAPKDYWDKRARGLGATNVRPATSCGEENLLGFPGDPYRAENILIHEFAHTIHQCGLGKVDPTFDRRLREIYEAAKNAGRWIGTYAMTDHAEYWAEGAQSWFDTNVKHDPVHNGVHTREELKRYDPKLAALLAEVFGDGPWRYVPPARRQPASAHLAGYDPSRAPHFQWPERLAHVALEHIQYPSSANSSPPVDLVLFSPDSPAKWGSPEVPSATRITFRNQTSFRVQIDWMDFEGRPRRYLVLEPGGEGSIHTYAGHVWCARSGDGTALGYYIAVAQPGIAVVKR